MARLTTTKTLSRKRQSCPYAKSYKGYRAPTCGCFACEAKWAEVLKQKAILKDMGLPDLGELLDCKDMRSAMYRVSKQEIIDGFVKHGPRFL